jgi:hypothetical protein
MKKKEEPEPSYYKVSKRIHNLEQFRELSVAAKWLFVTLCFLRNELTRKPKKGGKPDRDFYRHDKTLMADTGIKSLNTLKEARKELSTGMFIHFERNCNRKKGYVYYVCDDVYMKEMNAYMEARNCQFLTANLSNFDNSDPDKILAGPW